MSEQTAIVTRPYNARMAAKPLAEIDHETAIYDSTASYNPINMIKAAPPTKLLGWVDGVERANPCRNTAEECPKHSESL
jgi:hypothetical protein